MTRTVEQIERDLDRNAALRKASTNIYRSQVLAACRTALQEELAAVKLAQPAEPQTRSLGDDEFFTVHDVSL